VARPGLGLALDHPALLTAGALTIDRDGVAEEIELCDPQTRDFPPSETEGSEVHHRPVWTHLGGKAAEPVGVEDFGLAWSCFREVDLPTGGPADQFGVLSVGQHGSEHGVHANYAGGGV
jgi:hypothetical protein